MLFVTNSLFTDNATYSLSYHSSNLTVDFGTQSSESYVQLWEATEILTEKIIKNFKYSWIKFWKRKANLCKYLNASQEKFFHSCYTGFSNSFQTVFKFFWYSFWPQRKEYFFNLYSKKWNSTKFILRETCFLTLSISKHCSRGETLSSLKVESNVWCISKLCTFIKLFKTCTEWPLKLFKMII